MAGEQQLVVESNTITSGSSEASAARPLDIATESLLPRSQPKSPLLDALLLARRRWKTIFTIWAITLLVSTAYALCSMPIYTASGVIQVSSRDALGAGNPMLELAMNSSGGMELQTEVEIMRQRGFVLKVLRELHLHIIDPNANTKLSTEFDITLRGASPLDSRLTSLREAVTVAELKDGVFATAHLNIAVQDDLHLVVDELDKDEDVIASHPLTVGEVLETPRFRLALDTAPLAAGESFRFALMSSGPLVDQYLRVLSVKQLGTARTPTSLVKVSLTDVDRETAATVVNRLMERYLEQNLEWQALRASRSAEFIREQLEDIGRTLRKEEEELQVFAEKEQAIDLSTQARVTIENAATLEAEKAQIALQQRVIGHVLSSVKRKAQTNESLNLTSNFFEDELVAVAIAGLSEAEMKLEVLQATLTAQHPTILELEAKVQRQRKEIAKLLRNTRRNLASRHVEIDSELQQISGRLSAYPDKQLQLARLTRKVAVSERLYGFLLEKLQESEIMEAATTTDKRIVNSAALPHMKKAPKRSKLVATGAALGLCIGLAFVYLTRLMRQKMDTVESVREMTKYTVYATIPVIPNRVNSDGETVSDRVKVRDVWSSPHEPAPEAFRTLRVNVGFVPARPGKARVLQITSSQPGEGKSTVMSNLAVSLSKSGARVVIIDLDLRRPVQHRIWERSRSPGFTDFVAKSGQLEISEITQRIEEHNLDIIPAGSKAPETLSCIMSPMLPLLLKRLNEHYDYVLIDTPPIFVADTMVIGQYVDLLLVTARPGVVMRSNLSHALDFLDRLPSVRKGLVLNGVEREHTEYYYGKNYYYYSSSYGTDSSPNDHQEAA